MFTYNVLDKTELTEDRTAKYIHVLKKSIARYVAEDAPEEIVKACLICREHFEKELNFNDIDSPSETFVRIAKKLSSQRKFLNNTAFKLLVRLRLVEERIERSSYYSENEGPLYEAIDKCKRIEKKFDEYGVLPVESLEDYKQTKVDSDEKIIYIANCAIDDCDVNEVCGSLLAAYYCETEDIDGYLSDLGEFLLNKIVARHS
jgi:hypothetical protein